MPKQEKGSANRRQSSSEKPRAPRAPAVVVRESNINGRGGFAGRALKKGQLVIVYEGERISQGEGDKRYDDKPYTYLFELDDETLIDGAVDGNDARFINHSCRPNCEAWEERRRIVIRAMRNIREGEELTYDYALQRDPKLGAEEDAMYPCRCGTPRCRGTILVPLKRGRRKTKTPPS